MIQQNCTAKCLEEFDLQTIFMKQGVALYSSCGGGVAAGGATGLLQAAD